MPHAKPNPDAGRPGPAPCDPRNRRDPQDFRVLLVFPPQGHPTQPYLALPSLKAWLAQNGFPGATVWDLNLQAYDTLLSGDRLALAVERIRARAEADGLLAREQLAPADLDRYRLVADALAAGPYVAARIDEAKAAIRDPARFYDRPTYLWAMRTFEAGLKLVSTEFWPSLFTAHNYTQSTSIDNAADLFAGVDHPTENLFREFYEQHALPRIEAEMPDVLGISVTYGSQMVPALTLASMVKARWPGIHVTLGGGMLAYVGHRLAATGPIFDRADSILVYEGEKPLLELCRAVAAAGGVQRAEDVAAASARPAADGGLRERGAQEPGIPLGHARGTPDLSAVPNLLHRGADGRPAANGELLPLPIDDLPCPDFSDLPLHDYFSGELVLPIAPTRGCYYEKCGFCTLYTAIGPTYRERSVERLVADLQALVARHGTKHFYFIMDDLPPLLAKRIPDAFARARLDVRWWCDARFEERIFDAASLARLHAAGCRKLMFGFESGSQRVLDLVEKGTDLAEAERVLRAAHEAGISTTLYTMVGLPTETWEDASATKEFVLRNRDWIGELSLQVFNLDMVSPMYRDPARFGIARVIDDPRDFAPGGARAGQRPRDDLARYLEHESVSGMDRAAVRAAFEQILAAATEALPALRGDNFLYYRYKSHIFLYLDRFGRDAFRREGPAAADARADATAGATAGASAGASAGPTRGATPRDAGRTGLPAHVRLRDDAALLPLPFPYGAVRARLDRAWSDPTPLGGVTRSESHAAADATAVQRAPASLAFLGDEHRFLDLGADAQRLLAIALEQGTEAALEAFGHEHREAAGGFLARALHGGLLVPA